MSIVEALNVRNAVADAIDNTDSIGQAAEKLLTLGYIDVPAIMAMAQEDDELATTPTPPTTAVTTLSAATGSVGV
jgi:hypothetical protein